jgi:hypothetical protein
MFHLQRFELRHLMVIEVQLFDLLGQHPHFFHEGFKVGIGQRRVGS